MRTRSSNGSMWMSRGPQLHRLWMIRLHQPDDRGVAFVDVVAAPLPPSSLGLGEVDGRVGELLQHRVDRLGLVDLAVVPVDGLEDALLGRQGDLDLAVQDELQLFERLEVDRVADDDLERAVLLRPAASRRFRGRPTRAPVRRPRRGSRPRAGRRTRRPCCSAMACMISSGSA